MRQLLRALLVAGATTAVVIGGGLLALGESDEPDQPDEPETPFTTTALADYDTSSSTVPRSGRTER